MDKYTFFPIIVLISIAVHSTAQLEHGNELKNSVFLSEPYEIVAKQGKSLFSNLGIAHARNCGGAGRLLKVRDEACTTPLIGGACAQPAGLQQRGEVSFIPSNSTESLSVRTIVNDNQGEQVSWLTPNVSTDGPIQAEKEYVFQTGVTVGPKLRGKVLSVQVQIYRESDKVVEACTEAHFLIV